MTSRSAKCGAGLLCLLSLAAVSASAQTGIAVEGRVGVTFPTGDLSDGNTEAGLGMGADVVLGLRRSLAVYVGASRYSFSCQNNCAFAGDPRSTGLHAGLKLGFPSPRDAHVWGRGGVIAHELSDDDDTSDRKVGLELGAGVDMPIGVRWSLVPHLGYLNYGSNGTTVSFVTFGVGAQYRFR